MGTLYTVILLDQKCAEWLDTESVPHPVVTNLTRYPTPREILEVLHGIPDAKVIIHSDVQSHEWSAQIDMNDNSWAQMRVRDFSSEDTPHEFYFSKGWPEVVFVVTERLARLCGTLVVVDDSSCRPVVVSAGADTNELLRQYDVA